MAFKLKSGNASSFKNMGSSPVKQVDPDAPGTPGKPGYEPPVKRSDLDAKGKAIWDARRAKDKAKGEKSFDKFIKEPRQVVGPKSEFDKFIDKKPSKKVKSPAKQVKGDLPKNFNITGSSKGDKFGKYQKGFESKKMKTENFRKLGREIKTVSSKTNIGSKVIKAGKFLGGKALGVLGMMGAGTLSASAGNVRKKSEGEQIRDILTKHKLKGGKYK